jgi:uncharacterized protein
MTPDRWDRTLPLERVVEALRGLERYGPPEDRETFLADPARQRAVEVRMGLLAGHASDLAEELIKEHPRLPWQRLRALQDALARYGTGAPERAWTFLVNQVPDFLPQMEKLLASLRNPEGVVEQLPGEILPEGAGATQRMLRLRPDRVAVVRLGAEEPLPDWFDAGRSQAGLQAWVRTRRELTLYLPEHQVPEDAEAQRGFRVFELEGPLPFDAVGILEGLLAPLAREGIPILALSTYDTDLILVREGHLPRAAEVLRGAGASIGED